MKQHMKISAILMMAAMVLFACSSGGGGGTSAPQNTITVSGSINAATTWTSDKVYIVDNSVSVNAALTIKPGTIIKFTAGGHLDVTSGGIITADAGSAATPIIFTSIKDDAHGGDSNGDGTATTAARGDWGYVIVSGSGSVFNYCTFSYGGSNMPYTGTLVVDNCSVTIKNCIIAHNQGGTLDDTRAAALDASSAAAGTVLTGNTFYDNDIPLVVNGLYSVDNSNVFHYVASAGSSTITNKYNGIFWGGSYSVTGNITWSNTDVPYVISNNPLGIDAGSALTLSDKVIVKFDTGLRIDVAGTLMANGTTGIIFTSLKDDSVGGDTNGDGLSYGQPGDWGYIDVSESGSLLNRCRFSYGGSAKPYHATVEVANSSKNISATITNCTFAHNAGGTVDDNRAAALNLGGASAGTIVTGNIFYDNDMPLVIDGLVNVDNSNVFHLASSGTATVTNKYNGIFLDSTESVVQGNVTWSNREVPYVIYNTVLGIGDNNASLSGTLTLGNNVILKLQLARIDLYLYGTLNQGTGNYFTSLKDDSLLGDTSGDGSTTPMKGDWTGVDICQTICSYANWSNILYAANP